MKTNVILLIFLQAFIIKAAVDDASYLTYIGSYSNCANYSKIFKSKCEDKKTKTNACIYTIKNEDEDQNTYGPKEYALFNKCGKGKKCDLSKQICWNHDESYDKRKDGKSCNYDMDCESNSCVSNKCALASEHEVCENKYGEEIRCKAGLICTNDDDKPDDKKKCYKLAKENEDGTKYGCWIGLGINDKICKKYGTLEDGEKVTSCSGNINLLCKSGYCKEKKDEIGKYICASLTTEPTCSNRGALSSKGEWSDKDEIAANENIINYGCKAATDYSGTIKFYYRYSQLQSKLYEKFLEDYKDLDLEKINSDDKYAGITRLEDSLEWKTYKKWLLYKNAPELYAAGLIDAEGERNDDKKCEYDFILKNELNSSFIKFKALIIAMFALLF